MKMHLLLTDDIKATTPDTVKVTKDCNWGMLLVRFDHKDYYGLHCFIEGEEADIVNWLKPFDGFVKGNGNPMSETFEIAHIK